MIFFIIYFKKKNFFCGQSTTSKSAIFRNTANRSCIAYYVIRSRLFKKNGLTGQFYGLFDNPSNYFSNSYFY